MLQDVHFEHLIPFFRDTYKIYRKLLQCFFYCRQCEKLMLQLLKYGRLHVIVTYEMEKHQQISYNKRSFEMISLVIS